MDELEFYNGQLTGEEIDKRIITVSVSSFSSLPHTVSSTNILSKHILLYYRLSNPAAQTSDWAVATDNGSLTISGSINGTTAMTLILGVPL